MVVGLQSRRLPASFVLVSVTYGARWSMLRQALRSAKEEGADLAIVVDNASSENIEELARQEFGDFARVIRHRKNLGSAGGFRAGLDMALQLGAEYVLLLDDDNAIQPGCIAELRDEHQRWSGTVLPANLVALAFRPEHQADVVEGWAEDQPAMSGATFFGFSMVDIPAKLWGRTPFARQAPRAGAAASTYLRESAPYSGMFFHRDVLTVHGLPNEHLLLYSDDTEFSHRITLQGGKIVLVTRACLTDLERSWNVGPQHSSQIDSWLLGGSDLRVYYAARNRAYWERHCRPGHGAMRGLNRLAYLTMLRIRAELLNRRDRFRLFLQAIRDGEAKRLGEHAMFTL